MEKNEILLRLIEYYTNGNKTKFSEMINVSPSAVTAWIRRNTFDVQRICTYCTDVNPNYLLRGEGPIVTSDLPNEENSLLNEKK